MKIKKTLLSAFVSAVMFAAFAADVGVTVNGTDVSAGAGPVSIEGLSAEYNTEGRVSSVSHHGKRVL